MYTAIPLWINFLQVLIFILLARQAFNCYFKPEAIYSGITTAGASARKAVYVLAGRNTMMAIISLLALVLQNPTFLCFAFLMHSLRELQDMFIVPLTNPAGNGRIAIFLVFLFVFVIPEITAVITLYKMIN